LVGEVIKCGRDISVQFELHVKSILGMSN
jgi:hypothetical protein